MPLLLQPRVVTGFSPSPGTITPIAKAQTEFLCNKNDLERV
jgi:hypothetical protein